MVIPSEQANVSAHCSLRDAQAFGLSDTGPVRQHNEDRYLLDPQLELIAVADGMGGHHAGALASSLALELLRESLHNEMLRMTWTSSDPDATHQAPTLQAQACLLDALSSVNGRMYARNSVSMMGEARGMGTTLTGIWRPHAGGPLLMFHVGDSRLYRLRAGELAQLSRDQTWYQQALDAGHLDRLPARNLLLQAMGPSPQVDPQIRAECVEPGDLFMLCSDGLHGSVPHHEMSGLLASAQCSNLASVAQRLVQIAAHYGGRDNTTVVLIKYE